MYQHLIRMSENIVGMCLDGINNISEMLIFGFHDTSYYFDQQLRTMFTSNYGTMKHAEVFLIKQSML